MRKALAQRSGQLHLSDQIILLTSFDGFNVSWLQVNGSFCIIYCLLVFSLKQEIEVSLAILG